MGFIYSFLSVHAKSNNCHTMCMGGAVVRIFIGNFSGVCCAGMLFFEEFTFGTTTWAYTLMHIRAW